MGLEDKLKQVGKRISETTWKGLEYGADSVLRGYERMHSAYPLVTNVGFSCKLTLPIFLAMISCNVLLVLSEISLKL